MRNTLLGLQVILGLVVIISVLIQPSKSDALSGLIQGSKTETFFSKNKSRTKETLFMRVTIVSVALFAVNTLALSLI